MRFVVNLYRFLILAMLVLVLVALVVVIIGAAKAVDTTPQAMIMMVAGSVAIGIGIILSIGLIATFISMHDRIAEIARELRRVADRLEHARDG